MRTIISFTPNWFPKKIGIDFFERYHLDPGYRFESLLKMKDYIKRFFNQMDLIQKKWGKIDGFLNNQGVLNNAFKIRGIDIFADMIEDSSFAHHLFAHITDTMEKLIHLVRMIK